VIVVMREIKYATLVQEGDFWIVYRNTNPNVGPKNYVFAMIFDNLKEAKDFLIYGRNCYIPSFTCFDWGDTSL